LGEKLCDIIFQGGLAFCDEGSKIGQKRMTSFIDGPLQTVHCAECVQVCLENGRLCGQHYKYTATVKGNSRN